MCIRDSYGTVFAAAPSIAGKTLMLVPGHPWAAMTVVCICLFIGAMAKSAQVPLHVWLPDSMEGPTPISAPVSYTHLSSGSDWPGGMLKSPLACRFSTAAA